jgi:hypothetical protein
MGTILHEYDLFENIELIEEELQSFASDNGYKAEAKEDFNRHEGQPADRTLRHIIIYAPGGMGAICTFRLIALPEELTKVSVFANRFLEPPEPPEPLIESFIQFLTDKGFLP